MRCDEKLVYWRASVKAEPGKVDWIRGRMAKTDWKQTDGRVVSVDSIYTRGRLQLIVAFTYEVEGQLYKGKFYTFDRIHEGGSLIVRYNVSNPKQNDLEARQKRINQMAVAIAVPIVGAVLLLLWLGLMR